MASSEVSEPGSETGGEGAGDGGSATSDPGSSGDESSGQGSDGSSDGSSETGGDGSTGDDGLSGGDDGSGSDTEPPSLTQDPELIFHPTQPMVVDVRLHLSKPGEVTIAHDNDPGVFSSLFSVEHDGGAEVVTYRVRGLSPDSEHSMSGTLGPVGGGGEELEGFDLQFSTLEALPGFVAEFEVEQLQGTSEPVYRLFDIGTMTDVAPSGLAAVDTAGRTRWYLGQDNESFGAVAVHAAVKLRDDGSVTYVHELGLHVRDELGAEILDIEASELGLPGLHHDAVELPNGNFLALSFAFADVDYGGLIGMQHVGGDLLVEFTPTGEVVWEWNTFDYLDPHRTRAGFDGPPLWDEESQQWARDWTHGNGIVYDEEEDMVYVSFRHQDWLVKIDHATSELVWRMGQEGDLLLDGDPARDWFYHQHSPEWQEDGSLLLYDNGIDNPYLPAEEERSRAVLYSVDEQTMEVALLWQDDDRSFMAPIAGDADRMPGGHLLVLDSSIDMGQELGNGYARLRELDENGDPMTVWSLTTPTGYFVYRAMASERLVGQAMGE